MRNFEGGTFNFGVNTPNTNKSTSKYEEGC